MNVKIKRFDEKAVVPFKTHKEDFCYDCVATSCEEIAPNVYKYGLGWGFQLERPNNRLDDFVNLAIDARPRSSVWKTGMVLSNCEGTIDELYTGQVFAIFYHVMPDMPKYEVGDKIIQIKLGTTLPFDFIEVDELSSTTRGDGGFGSTGK